MIWEDGRTQQRQSVREVKLRADTLVENQSASEEINVADIFWRVAFT